MHHLRTVAFRRHSTAGAQRATSSSGHMGMLDLLAKLASNAKHLGLYAASDYSAGVADLPKETFSDRASRLQAIVHQKLLLDSSLGTQRSTTSALPLIAQIAEAIPAASKLSSSFNIVRGRWETAKYTLGQSRHRLRIAMR
ncbi:hypothetical protein EON65_03465 [archaeon]|nr:MAG: hypothetical protein EON65_03465 [archaeon]